VHYLLPEEIPQQKKRVALHIIRDYDLCSSGAVLVLAKKLYNNERLIFKETDAFKISS
jgi:hypothetical protein